MGQQPGALSMPEFQSGLYKGIASISAGLLIGWLSAGSHWGYGPLLLVLGIILIQYKSISLALVLISSWALAINLTLSAAPTPMLTQPLMKLTGQVVGLPVLSERSTRFDLLLDDDSALGARVRLRWYHPPEIIPGQRWQLQVKLRRPRNYQSPGSFDFRGYLKRQGIDYTGYVKQGWLQSSRQVSSLDHWRFTLRDRLQRLMPKPQAAWVAALVLGDHSLLSSAQWQVLASTGTTHLFIVSGMHIGLMAAVGGFLGRLLFFCIAFLGVGQRPWFIAAGALGLACSYAVASGFGLPAQRALLMLLFALCGWLAGWRPDHKLLLPCVFAAVLLIDPGVLFSPGLWLSFIAVAALLLSFIYPVFHERWFRTLCKAQCAILVALAPVLLFLGYPVSLIGPLLNFIAIPLTGFVLLPGFLITLLLDTLVGVELWVWWQSPLIWIEQGLVWLGELKWVIQPTGQGGLALCFGGLAAVLFLLPGRFFWAAGLALLLPLCWPKVETVPLGAVRISMLDVGQGLSILVETEQHRLLFDTGDRYDQFLLGQAVVEPYLQLRGIKSLDLLVLSHKDRDHVGGADFLTQRFGVIETLTGWHSEGNCHQHPPWQWDGIQFEFLPLGSGRYSDNDHSCVLLIRAGERKALLTGDIGERREQYLVNELAGHLKVDLLQVPHHGSASSSSTVFLAHTQPSRAWISAGFNNRYGHPTAAAVLRLQHEGAVIGSTARQGTQVLQMGPKGRLQWTSYLAD